jgi:hypothetical protein
MHADPGKGRRGFPAENMRDETRAVGRTKIGRLSFISRTLI